MAVYDIDLPNGKTIQVEGPEDASDDELISIARTHPSLTKQSAKPPAKADAEPSGMKAGQLPEMSSADQLLKEAKASTPGLQQAMPETFKATDNTGPLPTAGGMYDLLSRGDISGAYNSLPESVRDVTEVGAPLAAAALAAKTGYDFYQGRKEVGQGSQGIKARTIGGNNPPVTAAPSTPTVSAEPALSPKEAKIASEIESKYGFNWKDVKTNFNVSNVPITDPTQADILASAYKNQQAPATTAAPTTPEAEVIKPVAETPKTPAAPPAETPKTAVPLSIASTEAPAKKTGRPAAATLEPTTFRADLGPGDNWLYNTAGPERRKLILAEFNEGKPAKDEKTAYKLYKEYKKKYPKDMFGPVIPLEEAKSRGIPPPENYGKLGKAAKVGGVAGLALTAAEMANAAQKAQQGNQAPLRETIFNLLGMVPGLGTAFTAGTFSGGLNENNSAELARRRAMPPEITKR
jgi:hypothetical protein